MPFFGAGRFACADFAAARVFADDRIAAVLAVAFAAVLFGDNFVAEEFAEDARALVLFALCADFTAALFAATVLADDFAAGDFSKSADFAAVVLPVAFFVPDNATRDAARDADVAELCADAVAAFAVFVFFVAVFLAAAFAAIAKSPLFFVVPPICRII